PSTTITLSATYACLKCSRRCRARFALATEPRRSPAFVATSRPCTRGFPCFRRLEPGGAMRQAVQELATVGPLPREDEATEEQVLHDQALLTSLTRPATDQAARVLVPLCGPDECFELAWTLLHLIASAPGWPLPDFLADTDANEWHVRLRRRAAPHK